MTKPHHDRKATRLQGRDYGLAACYFITSTVKGRLPWLGEVIDAEMKQSPYGWILEQQWHWLLGRYPYIAGHAFVVMPDHFHAIIEIKPQHPTPGQKIKPLPELVGALKTTSSKRIRLAGGIGFEWQRSYHDRIIRDGAEFERIRTYIQENPARWWARQVSQER